MSTTLKWGLITGMLFVIFYLITNMMGLQQGGSMGIGILAWFVQFVVTFFTIYLGVKESRNNDLNGFMTMGQGFMTGFKIAFIAAVIAGVFALIYSKFIDPNMADKMMATAEAQWDKMNVPEEQREMSRKWTGYMFNPFIMAPFTIIWLSLGGLVKALIAGAILKKEAPPTVMPVS